MTTFLKNDSVPSFETLCAELPRCKFQFELASLKFDSKLVVQSKQFSENSGIPKFSVKVKQDFTFNAYHMGVKCEIRVLNKPAYFYVTDGQQLKRHYYYWIPLKLIKRKVI